MGTVVQIHPGAPRVGKITVVGRSPKPCSPCSNRGRPAIFLREVMHLASAQWREENADKMRAYRREWYQKNKERAKDRVAERRRELAQWFQEFKSSLKCIKCGEDHPYCLEFHHSDPNAKEMCVSEIVRNGRSIKRILEEIKKCVVLCANCHRKEHHPLDTQTSFSE